MLSAKVYFHNLEDEMLTRCLIYGLLFKSQAASITGSAICFFEPFKSKPNIVLH